MRKALIVILIISFVTVNTGVVYATEANAQTEFNQSQSELKVAAEADLAYAEELPAMALDDDPNHESPFHQEQTSLGSAGVKGLSGSFNVDQFSGAAVYGYNLSLPPGRSGLTPSISLNYNSHQSAYDSIVGYSWDIAQSYVARSARKSDQLYIANDFTLVLNGQSIELKPMNLIDETHGEYGAKAEEAFLQVEFLEDDSWQAVSKSGQVLIFGTQAAARQDNPEDEDMIYKWMLEEIRDKNDNFISYEYYKEEGQIYPKTIKYTGHGETDGPAQVRFEPFYSGPDVNDERADIHTGYASQFAVITKYLVSDIIVLTENANERKYSLTYQAGENGVTSLFASIQRFGYEDGNWIGLPASSFTYQDQSGNWTDDTANWDAPVISTMYDGDYTRTYGSGPIEANADGWTDYAISTEALLNTKNDESWGFDVYTGLPDYPLDVGQFADFNGDKLADYIGRESDFWGPHTLVKINNPVSRAWNTSGLWTDNLPEGADPNFVVDINGDGLADMLQVHTIGGNTWEAWIWLNDGDGTWSNGGTWADHDMFTNPSWSEGLFFVDVNNDGLPDMIKNGGSTLYSPTGVYLNNGTGWSEEPNFADTPGGWWEYGGARFADINNDGLVDVISSQYNGITQEESRMASINNGNDWFHDEGWEVPFIFTVSYVNQNYWDKGVRLFDINADGALDIVQNYYVTYNQNLNEINVLLGDSHKPNVLAAIDNGYGGETEIEYQASARIQDQSGNYRNSDLPFNLYTVKSVTVVDGLGDEIITDYEYFDGAYYVDAGDPLENQYAGFHQVNQIQGDKIVKSYFHQGGGANGQSQGEFEDHITKKGKMYRQEIYQDLGEDLQLLSQTINKWAVDDLGNGRTFVKLASSLTYDYEDGVLVDELEAMREQGFKAPADINEQAKDNQVLAAVAPQEIVSQRTATSKQFRAGDTADGYPQYRMEVYAQPIHYQDEAGQYQEIDTALIDNGESWQMSQAEYQAELPKILNQNNSLVFKYKNEQLGIKPVELNWVNNDQSKSILSPAREAGGSVSGNQAIYSSAFGADLDLEVTLLNQALRKESVIQNSAALGAIDPAAEYLEAVFELNAGDLSAVKITDETGQIKEISLASGAINETTAGKIEFIAKNGKSLYIWQPYAVDQNGASIGIRLNLAKSSGKIFLNKLIPASWLKTATYPVRTDATVSYVSGSADGFVAYHGNMFQSWQDAIDMEQGNVIEDESINGAVYAYDPQLGMNGPMLARAFLPFDTSGLLDDITITEAELSVVACSTYDLNEVYVVNSNQHTGGLESIDYSSVGDVSGGVLDLGSPGSHQASLNATGRAWIDVQGWTKLALRSAYDFEAESTDVYQSSAVRMSEYNEQESRPKLTIDYYYNNDSPAPPTELETEGEVNPIDVTDQAPEFSAIYNDPNPGDLAVDYRIQVIEESGDFSVPADIIWDSGQEALASSTPVGQRSEEITYGGGELALDGIRYFWRVKFWDDSGLLYSEGAWSEPAYFEMDGSASPAAPDGLLAEDYENPVDITDTTPEFSAIYNDPNPRDIAQWYRLQVDNNQDFSSPSWDSQKTLLNQLIDNGFRSEDISYGGDDLPYDGATYYWRVKFWDDEGENGTEGVWSSGEDNFTMFDDDDLLDNASIAVTEYDYDSTNGNVVEELHLGQVTAADNGVYLDQAGDSKIVNYEYAQSQAGYLESAVKKQTVTDPQAQQSTEQEIYYDGLEYGQVQAGNLTKEDLMVGNIEYEYSFNDYGLVTQKEDPLGQVTSITYDEANYYPAETINDLNQTVLTEYDLKTGQVKRTEDPNGLVEERDYDVFGRLTAVRRTDPDDAPNLLVMETYEYHDDVNPSWVKQSVKVDANNWLDLYTYFDGLGRKIQAREESLDGDYIVVSLKYDAEGNVEKQSIPYLEEGSAYQEPTWNLATQSYTSYAYDAKGRALTETFQSSTHNFQTTYVYDGWNVLITDPEGNQKKLQKDAHGNLVQTDEYLNGLIYSTYYEYNYLNKITNITDSLSNERNFTYDSLGRLTSQEEMHAPAALAWGVWTYEYDDASNLVRKTDPKGQIVEYDYDDLNRLLTEDFIGQAGIEVRYVYDVALNGLGRLGKVSFNSGDSRKYDYDVWGRAVNERGTLNNVFYQMYFSYNLNSQPMVIQYQSPEEYYVSYGYNQLGQAASLAISEDGVNYNNIINSVSYSPLKQIAGISYTNGTETANTFDPLQAYRLTQKQTVLGAVNLQDLTYAYDSAGNIISLTDASDTILAKETAYQYDDLYRLTQAQVTDSANNDDYLQTYAYDIIGNITDKSDIGNYLYGNNNPYQASTINNQAYAYDLNGNLTSDNAQTYNYNYQDRLIKVISADQMVVSAFQYDNAGQRTYKKAVDHNQPTTTETYYFNRYFEARRVNQQLDSITKHLFFGNQRVAQVKNVDDINAVSFIFTDHLGSSSVVTDSTGVITAIYDYYPYGDVRIEQEMGVEVATRFTGQELDEETDLHYYGARYYEAGVAKFNQPDELSAYVPYSYQTDPQKLNEYAYARNNPIKYIDPDGRSVILAAYLVGTWIVFNMPAIITTLSALVGGSYAASELGAATGYIIEGDYTSAQQCTDNAILAEAGVGAVAGAALAADGVKDTKSKQTKTATGKTDPETGGEANVASKPTQTTAQTPTITPGQAITSAEQVPGNVRNAIPQSWGSGQTSQKGGGWRWQDTKSQADVRFGTGDPNSPYPNSQNLYVKVNNANGQPLDKNGNLVVGYERPSTAPEAHIPLDEFNPSNFSFLNQ